MNNNFGHPVGLQSYITFYLCVVFSLKFKGKFLTWMFWSSCRYTNIEKLVIRNYYLGIVNGIGFPIYVHINDVKKSQIKYSI